MNLTFVSIILFVTFLVNLSIGLFVLIRSDKKPYKIVFSLTSIVIAIWNLINFISFTVVQSEQVMLWAQLALVPAFFIPSLLVYFSFVFPKNKKVKKWNLLLLIFFPVSSLPFIFTKYNVVGFEKVADANTFIPGPLYYYFTAYFVILVAWSVINLIKSYKEADSYIPKKQIKYILTGIATSSFIGIVTNSILPMFAFPYLNTYGASCTIIFAFCTAYAITRYRFMDFRIAIRKSIVYIFLLFIAISVSLAFIISLYFILKKYFINEEQVALIISIALLIIILPTLQKYLQGVIDRYINKDKIDLSVTIEELAGNVDQANQLSQLLAKTADFLNSEIKVKQIKFLVRDFRVPELKYVCQYPFDCKLSNPIELNEIKEYFYEHDIAVKEELSYVNYGGKIDKILIKKLKKFLDATNSQVLIPLRRGNKFNGYMLLSEKSDSSIYSKEDIDFLNNLVKQLNGVLDKVLFYEETVERVRREFGPGNVKKQEKRT